MMELLRQYALSLVGAALISAVLLRLAPGGTTGSLLRLVCSAVMLCVLLAPLCRVELPDTEGFFEEFFASGELTARAGEDMAREERFSLIKAGLEAYLQDRAAERGCRISADVRLDTQGYPCSVLLTGEAAPQQRRELSIIITEDLGIPEEDQQWKVEDPENGS